MTTAEIKEVYTFYSSQIFMTNSLLRTAITTGEDYIKIPYRGYPPIVRKYFQTLGCTFTRKDEDWIIRF